MVANLPRIRQKSQQPLIHECAAGLVKMQEDEMQKSRGLSFGSAENGKAASVNADNVQRPRAFYRREAESKPEDKPRAMHPVLQSQFRIRMAGSSENQPDTSSEGAIAHGRRVTKFLLLRGVYFNLFG